jgi:hypothetical protein
MKAMREGLDHGIDELAASAEDEIAIALVEDGLEAQKEVAIRQAAAPARSSARSSRTALQQRPSRRAHSPPEADRAFHVRPRQIRSAAHSRPVRSLKSNSKLNTRTL